MLLQLNTYSAGFFLDKYFMHINELFTRTKVNWDWGFVGSEEMEAKFMVGEIEYQVYIYTSDPESGSWEIEFKINNPEVPTGGRFGVTGTGNAAIVMSTVVDVVKGFLNKKRGEVTQITFSAKERSRRDLYARMVKRLLPTWIVTLNAIDFTLTSPFKT